MTTRIEQKEKSRRQLLDAALRLSADRGFANISLREVTREAGLAPTSFYRHFHNMEDLGLALVEEVIQTLRQLMSASRDNISNSQSSIQSSVETFMVFLKEHQQVFHLLVGEQATGFPSMRQALNKGIQEFTQDLSEDLKTGGKSQSMPLKHHDVVAEMAITCMFHSSLAALNAEPAEQERLAKRILLQMQILLRGAEAMTLGWVAGDEYITRS